MTDFKLTEEEQIALLRKCEKISSVKAPNEFGQKWVARVISIVDADTLTVAKYDETDGSLDRYIVRITEIDSAEIKHKDGERVVTPYEQALGSRAKSTVLHEMLPSLFEICDTDKYDWRVQQPIFDKNAVIVYVDCPAKDHLGKPMKADPYGRTLAAVAFIKEDGTKVDIADLLIGKGLADRYYGGTKLRSFMKDAPTEPKEVQLTAKTPAPETPPFEGTCGPTETEPEVKVRPSRKKKMPTVDVSTSTSEVIADRQIKKMRNTKKI